MKSLIPRLIVVASVLALACGTGCSRTRTEETKAPAGKSLDDALAQALGGPVDVTLRAEWSDGSGGPPERFLCAKDKTVYYLKREPEVGWRLVGKVVPEAGRGPHGELAGPIWIGFSKKALGFLVATFKEGVTGGPALSITPYSLEAEAPAPGPFHEPDPASIQDMTDKLVAGLDKLVDDKQKLQTTAKIAAQTFLNADPVAQRAQPGPAPGAGQGVQPPVLTPGSTCEAARTEYTAGFAKAGGTADATEGSFASVLSRGSYLNGCSVPPNVAVEVCAAIQNGRAVGVTVRTTPANAPMIACVTGQVRSLSFPSHPRLDVSKASFPAK